MGNNSTWEWEKNGYNSTSWVEIRGDENWWALLALILVVGTAAGNILVCLAITWERRLQNVTNYFLMSLAVTDLMVAVLVMPLGILTLVKGFFPFAAVYCLAWMCLDVLFCTASIMHLCTISVDRYLSLSYPMKFGRNKTRRRVVLKITFVWILSIAMSLPLSLMYAQDHESLLVDGTCQIPDPLYKLIGSIVSFYVPLIVMMVTYALTVRLLAAQQQSLGHGKGWTGMWLSSAAGQAMGIDQRRFLANKDPVISSNATPQHHLQGNSNISTDTDLSALDLWLPDSSAPDPTPSTMTALHVFGAEMLKLSRGLESFAEAASHTAEEEDDDKEFSKAESTGELDENENTSSVTSTRSSTPQITHMAEEATPLKGGYCHLMDSDSEGVPENTEERDEVERYKPRIVGELLKKDIKKNTIVPRKSFVRQSQSDSKLKKDSMQFCERRSISERDFEEDVQKVQREDLSLGSIVNRHFPVDKAEEPNSSLRKGLPPSPTLQQVPKNELLVKWHHRHRWKLGRRRRGEIGTSVVKDLRSFNGVTPQVPDARLVIPYGGIIIRTPTTRSHPSRTSSVISRNSSRHGRIIRLEQKATKVLGVVFFTFVILWAPFFVLNLLPTICEECEKRIPIGVFDFVTWLGYASSMVNPIFYTIFNKVFRDAFKKVLTCRYRKWTVPRQAL